MATLPSLAIDGDSCEKRFVIRQIGWSGYEALLRDVLNDRRSIRVTYDRGDVELMSPHFSHERYGYLLGRMVQAITEELDIPICSIRSMTLRSKELDRGLEADEGYYFANAHRMVGVVDLDLENTPPPDLAIEIEITNSVLARLPVYAALGVPEIWRFDGDRLIVLLLGTDSVYRQSESSLALPFVPLGEIVRFIEEHEPGEDTRWARSFRARVREVLLPIDRNQAAPE